MRFIHRTRCGSLPPVMSSSYTEAASVDHLSWSRLEQPEVVIAGDGKSLEHELLNDGFSGSSSLCRLSPPYDAQVIQGSVRMKQKDAALVKLFAAALSKICCIKSSTRMLRPSPVILVEQGPSSSSLQGKLIYRYLAIDALDESQAGRGDPDEPLFASDDACFREAELCVRGESGEWPKDRSQGRRLQFPPGTLSGLISLEIEATGTSTDAEEFERLNMPYGALCCASAMLKGPESWAGQEFADVSSNNFAPADPPNRRHLETSARRQAKCFVSHLSGDSPGICPSCIENAIQPLPPKLSRLHLPLDFVLRPSTDDVVARLARAQPVPNGYRADAVWRQREEFIAWVAIEIARESWSVGQDIRALTLDEEFAQRTANLKFLPLNLSKTAHHRRFTRWWRDSVIWRLPEQWRSFALPATYDFTGDRYHEGDAIPFNPCGIYPLPARSKDCSETASETQASSPSEAKRSISGCSPSTGTDSAGGDSPKSPVVGENKGLEKELFLRISGLPASATHLYEVLSEMVNIISLQLKYPSRDKNFGVIHENARAPVIFFLPSSRDCNPAFHVVLRDVPPFGAKACAITRKLRCRRDPILRALATTYIASKKKSMEGTSKSTDERPGRDHIQHATPQPSSGEHKSEVSIPPSPQEKSTALKGDAEDKETEEIDADTRRSGHPETPPSELPAHLAEISKSPSPEPCLIVHPTEKVDVFIHHENLAVLRMCQAVLATFRAAVSQTICEIVAALIESMPSKPDPRGSHCCAAHGKSCAIEGGALGDGRGHLGADECVNPERLHCAIKELVEQTKVVGDPDPVENPSDEGCTRAEEGTHRRAMKQYHRAPWVFRPSYSVTCWDEMQVQLGELFGEAVETLWWISIRWRPQKVHFLTEEESDSYYWTTALFVHSMWRKFLPYLSCFGGDGTDCRNADQRIGLELPFLKFVRRELFGLSNEWARVIPYEKAMNHFATGFVQRVTELQAYSETRNRSQ